MTKWQQRIIRPSSVCTSLVYGGAFFWIFRMAAQKAFNPDPVLHWCALAFGPAVGAAMFAFATWADGKRIVEFTCDERSFRFRKLGAAEAETRDLSEIVKVEDMGRGRIASGYCVGFRDGSEATVSVRLAPDGPLIGDWLREHSAAGAAQPDQLFR